MKPDRAQPTQEEKQAAWDEFSSTVSEVRREQTKAIDRFGKRLVTKKTIEIHETLERAYAKSGDK